MHQPRSPLLPPPPTGVVTSEGTAYECGGPRPMADPDSLAVVNHEPNDLMHERRSLKAARTARRAAAIWVEHVSGEAVGVAVRFISFVTEFDHPCVRLVVMNSSNNLVGASIHRQIYVYSADYPKRLRSYCANPMWTEASLHIVRVISKVILSIIVAKRHNFMYDGVMR